MNRSRWSIVTLFAVALLAVVSSQSPDVDAQMPDPPVITSVSALRTPAGIKISGTVTGNVAAMVVTETQVHGTTGVNANGEFSFTVTDMGQGIVYVVADDPNGTSAEEFGFVN